MLLAMFPATSRAAVRTALWHTRERMTPGLPKSGGKDNTRLVLSMHHAPEGSGARQKISAD